jgi:cytochrome c oxidase assembly protein subunit 15
MAAPDRRVFLLRKFALVCTALVLVITSLSAYMRLSRAGLGCEPWPHCYGQSVVQSPPAAQPVTQGVALARLAHRVAAMAALVVIVLAAMTALGSRPRLWREGAPALGLLAVALFLAVLGRWTADSRLPAVVLGNLLAGFAMFALSCRLVGQTSAGRARKPLPRTWIAVALVVLVAQVALGGMVSAGHAGLSCPSLERCDLSAGSLQTLNPLQAPVADAAGDPTRPTGSLLHLLHRAASLLLIAVVLPIGVLAIRRGQRAGALLIALLLLQPLLGALLVLRGLPLPLALAHNIAAGALLATLASLAGGFAPAQEKVSGLPSGSSAM